jgi:hypothetical protein
MVGFVSPDHVADLGSGRTLTCGSVAEESVRVRDQPAAAPAIWLLLVAQTAGQVVGLISGPAILLARSSRQYFSNPPVVPMVQRQERG